MTDNTSAGEARQYAAAEARRRQSEAGEELATREARTPEMLRLDGGAVDKPRSLASDAWREMRRRPMFWFALALIVLFIVMAVAPGLFTSIDPHEAILREARSKPGENGAVFGRDIQGYDIYARTIYGARASIMVGILTTIGTTLLGGIIGIAAGFYGGWFDALLSRVTDMFFALPMLLGGIILMTSVFPNTSETSFFAVVLKVVLVLTIFGWPPIARLMRSAVLQVKPQEYVQAARALGASPWRIIVSHILPNAMAPVLVVATINLGVYIAAEATLSFLGIGLVPPAISWGVAISDATKAIRTLPHILFFPSLFLSLTVLAFILMGDVIRDAFDPKQR
ncbi:ABC transporter permease [Mobilicoccus pelagius]|uniref:Putative peptide ABC transporter permease protein n=2 Tax=Mobilicoccus TaxID=984996 RepID=H5UV48_9MICO|nr:putative peptide ABC transporter permease protein [Mobilicoccus pelagius NBRC 104925]